MSMLNSGPKLDWTRDNQMFLRYKKWRSKVELIFRSALSKATPEEKTSYLKYWLGDEGLPLIEKWESTGKLDYSNAEEAPLSSGFPGPDILGSSRRRISNPRVTSLFLS